MKYILNLKKNHDIEYYKISDDIDLKNSKYLMIPINRFNCDTYVLIKPNFYLKHMTKIKIEYTLNIVEVVEYKKSEIVLTFPEVKEEYFGIYEAINALHLLQRIEYFNCLSDYGLVNIDDNDKERYLVFTKFKIEVFEKNNLIYYYKFKSNKELTRNVIILDKIKEFYSLEEIKNEHIVFCNNKWDIQRKYPKYGIYSLYLEGTHSYFNIDYDNLALLKSVRSSMINIYFFIIKNSLSLTNNAIGHKELWYFETERILEFLTYFNLTKVLSIWINNIFGFGEMTDNIKSVLMIDVEIFSDQTIHMVIIDENKNPLKYFINKLIEKGVDKNE